MLMLLSRRDLPLRFFSRCGFVPLAVNSLLFITGNCTVLMKHERTNERKNCDNKGTRVPFYSLLERNTKIGKKQDGKGGDKLKRKKTINVKIRRNVCRSVTRSCSLK